MPLIQENGSECLCYNCVFYNDTYDEVGECRRYAPKRIHGVGTGSNETQWPEMRYNDWCGEWKEEEE